MSGIATIFDVSDENVVLNKNEIRITKVVLENYRNFTFKEFFFDNKSTLLLGKNGLGKTNVIEAIFWALNGQLFSGDSQNDKIGITPVNAEQGVKTRVAISFTPDFTFEKIFNEKYNKVTGEYQGTETAYYINGALVKQQSQAILTLKNYLGIKKLDDDFSMGKLKALDTMALMYNINYLEMINYQLLRELIVAIVGEVNYRDVINANLTKYKALEKHLQAHNNDVEALRSAKTTEKNGDRNKQGLQDQIALCENMINEYKIQGDTELDLESLKVAKEGLELIDKEVAKLTAQKSQSSAELTKDIDLEIAQKQNAISKLKEEIRSEYDEKIKNFENSPIDSEIKAKKKSIDDEQTKRYSLNYKTTNLKAEIERTERTLANKKEDVEKLEQEKLDLMETYKKLKDPSGDTITCPHCDKPFDLSESKEHQEHLESKLKDINEKGKANKLAREQLEEGIETLTYEIEQEKNRVLGYNKELEAFDKKIKQLETELSTLNTKRDSESADKPTLDFDVEPIQMLEESIQTLEKRKHTLKNDNGKALEDIESQIESLQDKRTEYQEIVSKENTRNSYIKNAKEKELELQKLNDKLVEVEDVLTLVKELQKDMFTLLNSKVEKTFGDNIQFRLFKINLDGTIDTRVCDMLVKDIHGNFVNLKTINSGMYPIRVIEFITKVKEFYNIPKSFIFVDELFGLLDDEHKEMLNAYGEQVIGTGYKEVGKIEVVK